METFMLLNELKKVVCENAAICAVAGKAVSHGKNQLRKIVHQGEKQDGKKIRPRSV